jgi:hypothetical protein
LIIKVAGFDPSLQNFGMVKGDFDTITGTLLITGMLLSETKPDNKNKSVRKNSQDLTRAITHYNNVSKFLGDVTIVFVEIPIGSQNSRSMASYGISIGVLASVVKPMIQVTPTEVKLAATNNKNATKNDMISWATNKYPNAPWLTRTIKGTVTYINKNEHLADALAAIHAGVNTSEFRTALTLIPNP